MAKNKTTQSPTLEPVFYSPEHLWLNEGFNTLKKSFDSDKLPHGLLMVAPSKSGKLLLATSIAQSIVCETSRSSAAQNVASLNKACGHCKNCLLVNAHSHPDITIVDCLIDNKGKLKKSIGIDQIRQLTDKLVETSQLSGWRIAIIRSVEKMTRGAFNAILKTLEEPGDKTFILMLADSLHQVPATIKSRCQLLRLKLTQEVLLPWLSATLKCDETVALASLKACHYAPFATVSYIKEDSSTLFEQINLDLDRILQNTLTPNDFIAQHSDLDGQLWVHIANYFQNAQLSILKSKQGPYLKVPRSIASELYGKLLELNRAQSAGSNLQTNLQLEAILIHWFEIGRKIVHY